MATIVTTWANSTPASSDNVGEGDDRIRETKAGVRERAQNAGLYWPDVSASVNSGVPFISPDALVANEFNIFDVLAGVPDPTRKLVKVTRTTLDTHASVAVNVGLTLSEANNRVLTKASVKRTVVMSVGGLAKTSQPSDARTLIGDRLFYMPQVNSDASALVGTLKEFAVVMMSEPSADTTFDLQRVAVGSAWASDQLPAIGGSTSLLAGVLTIPTAGTFLGARYDTAALFAGTVFPTLAGGDVLRVVVGSNSQTIEATAFIVVDFNWP